MQISRKFVVVTGLAAATASAAALAMTASAGPAGGARASVATVGVTLKEFKLIPSPAGTSGRKVTFAIKNTGKLEHEFIVMRTSTRAGKLPVSGNRAKEIGVVAEAEDIAPGATRRLKVSFKRGHYVLLCNIKGHYRAGQFADFTVR
jgi:uncharacterized cupredoxin-like copper-binding protein